MRALVPAYLTVIAGVPALLTLWLARLTAPPPLRALLGLLAPVAFAFAYVTVAGLLSRLTLAGMVAGRFPRELGHAVYGPRRLHALCWTAVYYFTPLYHAVLALPLLKRFTFRLFGYRGALDFTVYPDSWLRDLPLLEVGSGAYLSNRATIGTNICMSDGTIIVAPVRIGARAVVGHMAMLAPGVVVGEDAEVGVGCAIGLNVIVGRRSKIGPTTTVNHGAILGERCDIGTMCLIGAKAVVHDGVRVPAGMVVPPRAVLRSQEDVDALVAVRRGARMEGEERRVGSGRVVAMPVH